MFKNSSNVVPSDLLHLHQCNIYCNATNAVNVRVTVVVHHPSIVWSVVNLGCSVFVYFNIN